MVLISIMNVLYCGSRFLISMTKSLVASHASIKKYQLMNLILKMFLCIRFNVSNQDLIGKIPTYSCQKHQYLYQWVQIKTFSVKIKNQQNLMVFQIKKLLTKVWQHGWKSKNYFSKKSITTNGNKSKRLNLK